MLVRTTINKSMYIFMRIFSLLDCFHFCNICYGNLNQSQWSLQYNPLTSKCSMVSNLDDLFHSNEKISTLQEGSKELLWWYLIFPIDRQSFQHNTQNKFQRCPLTFDFQSKKTNWLNGIFLPSYKPAFFSRHKSLNQNVYLLIVF